MHRSVTQIAESVYRIGSDRAENGKLNTNSFLVKCGNESILVNTGPYSKFSEIEKKILSVADLESISLIVITSVSPDLSSALPLFLNKLPDVKIAVHWRGARLLSSSYPGTDFFIINENRWEFDALNGEKLLFLPASNLYSPEEIHLYLVKQKLLFSSSLFSSFTSPSSSLYIRKNDYELMKSYHEHYFSSTEVINSAVEKIKQLRIDIIAPGRGGVLKDDISFFYNEISRVECGSFKGVSRIKIKDEKEYFSLCSSAIQRLVSIYSYDEVVPMLNDSDIKIDADCNIIESHVTDGEVMWEKLFQAILEHKGLDWLSMIESLVRKYSRQYSIPYPAAFKSILINLKSKEVALDKEAVRLHGTKNRIRKELEETKNSLTKCPVTGLKNEIFFRNYMAKEIEGSLKNETNNALLMIGIDNIMDINARFGREGGDEALRGISYILRNYIDADYSRVTHYLFKMNSAAFSYYIPDCSDQYAVETAENLRSLIADSTSYLEKITVSIGVMQLYEYFNETVSSMEIVGRLIDTGYSRIHSAKKGGGNTICDKSDESSDFTRLTDPILIIDPDIKYAELLKSRLKEMGFFSDILDNGNDALRMIKKTRPLAIICETMVPGVNGFSIRENMLSDSTLNAIPFIFTSHKKNEEYIEKAVKLNVLYYYSKPYSILELTGLIENLSKIGAE